MQEFYLKPTKHTPEIRHDPENNLLEIKGVSYPADIEVCYADFFSWLESRLKDLDDDEFTINLELAYLNSSSKKVMWDFFQILDQESGRGKNITINWIFDEEDDDKLEMGEEFMEEVEFLKFNLVKSGDVIE